MRAAIRAAVPGLADGFGYRMPSLLLDGKTLVWYAAFTNHTSMFPMTDDVRKANAAALEGYKTSKGTVQFPLERRLPVGLVKKLAKARRDALLRRAR